MTQPDNVYDLNRADSAIGRVDPLFPIYRTMERYEVRCSASEFHEAVNIAFHAAEAPVYDLIHREMWETIPEQVALLAADCIGVLSSKKLKLLDVGCGTGLSTHLLLQTALGQYIQDAYLIDTSTAMLERARKRAAGWSIGKKFAACRIEALPRMPAYDVVVICSVLHHIPDLSKFLQEIQCRMNPESILIHLQDPNGDYLKDPDLQSRIHALKTYHLPAWEKLRWRVQKASAGRLTARVRKMLTPGYDYIARTNAILLADKVISKPMLPDDIWSVTDIHVHDDRGVSIRELRELLPGCTLLSLRSYSFFGAMKSEIPPKFASLEQMLIRQNAPNGSHVAGAWRKK
jgi:2-polyprenyl-3-methyl-5-hydroxy-6-metoxy-1,4-benzoquinol methylase